MSRLLLLLPLLLLQDVPFRVFPPDNPWNWDISRHPVHPDSAKYIASIGADKTVHPDFGTEYRGAPIGIPYVLVSRRQKKVNVEFRYDGESDKGPYPIPDDAPIEGGPDSDGDRHVIVIDKDNRMLYEIYKAYKTEKGWKADSGAIFDLKTNKLRPDGWTSADAAGLPIFPGLVRYDEVKRGVIPHALRFTVSKSQKAYIWPARHHASSRTDKALPPMGLRLRLKKSFDMSSYNRTCKVILTALQKHGMIVADNGSDWYISGAPDKRWKMDQLRPLKKVKGSDFEVVRTVDGKGKPIYPPRRR